ncbi:MAG: hypothetical protein K2Z81_12545, partial [Cyanobacteria bacterium]|nr:hypothetical protein [Cyanobacteriota bacterium]
MKSNVVHPSFAASSAVPSIKVETTQRVAHPNQHSCSMHGIFPKGYEIIRRIGFGGMGTIYKARQILLDKIVAIKILSHCDDADAKVRFRMEARAASSLNHPN